MNIEGKGVVVTGGGNGIGAELARRAASLGASYVAVADLDEAAARGVAESIGAGAFALGCDVSREAELRRLTEAAEARGPIGLFCSNAGVISADPDFDDPSSAPDAVWMQGWSVHVMAHVYAVRAALPAMRARKSGYFLHTVSAAGLLSQIGSAVYSTTKHAAIGFAESLAIAVRDQGIGVSVLCPQGVATNMTKSGFFAGADVDGVLSAEACVDAAIAGLEAEKFLILPHPNVAEYMQVKAGQYDRWLGGMRKLRRHVASLRAG